MRRVLCFMVDGSMCCGVTEAALMVRVGRENDEQMLATPNVSPLKFASRRPKGFVQKEFGVGARPKEARYKVLRLCCSRSFAFVRFEFAIGSSTMHPLAERHY